METRNTCQPRRKWSGKQVERAKGNEMVAIEEFLECCKRLENAVAVTLPRDKNKQRIVECLTDNHVARRDLV